MTVDIREFIEARVADDEAVARAVDVPDWRAGSSWAQDLQRPLPSHLDWHGGQFPLVTAEDVAHIVRHDPARVLRDVEAKRRVLRRHLDVNVDGDLHACAGCGSGDEAGDGSSLVWVAPGVNECPELRDLAAVYAEHPDYREEWRP